MRLLLLVVKRESVNLCLLNLEIGGCICELLHRDLWIVESDMDFCKFPLIYSGSLHSIAECWRVFQTLYGWYGKQKSLCSSWCRSFSLLLIRPQEVLLPGHLVTIYVKEKLQEWLLKSKKLLQDEADNRKKTLSLEVVCSIPLDDVKKAFDKNPAKQVGSAVENMLKTGRLVTQLTLDLKEYDPFSLLMYRTWGFVCMHDTPDGAPCGLLNHLTASCHPEASKSANQLEDANFAFVVVSKTFTTAETMLNARTFMEWISSTLGPQAVSKHMVAVSTNLKHLISRVIDKVGCMRSKKGQWHSRP
ncbi:unnamed protein product [Lactuca virosa]|uniref:DNA-directed RNA polymerase n=1 Tax=Lactuca virosa TaxID=75947 RepID=A0AAU9LIZ3_9ASTR|nr:unnamed protein product [Lactuca virosa]